MRYVIVGNSAAGIHALEAIRSVNKKGEITVISDEDYPPYCRCLITNYLAGTHTEEDLLLRPKDFYERLKVKPLLGKRIVSIAPRDKEVILSRGGKIQYDKLLIATGARAKSLGLEGEKKEGVFSFRTIQDAREILSACKDTKRVVVLGGGLIGLKAGYALKKRGLEVIVVIKSSQIMSQVIDKGGAELIREHLERNGIKIKTELGATEILGKDGIEAVALDNGEELECEMVIIGKGVSPNIELVKDSGVNVHWGIITDQRMRTNIEDIYAAGDVAETYDVVTGESALNALWTTAAEQGRIAGYNMAGVERFYDGSLAENAVEFFGLPVVSLGLTRPRKEGYEEIVKSQPRKGIYKKVLLKDNRIVGAVLVGQFKNSGVILSLLKKRIDVSKLKDIILEDWFGYAKIKDYLLEETGGWKTSIPIEGQMKPKFTEQSERKFDG